MIAPGTSQQNDSYHSSGYNDEEKPYDPLPGRVNGDHFLPFYWSHLLVVSAHGTRRSMHGCSAETNVRVLLPRRVLEDPHS